MWPLIVWIYLYYISALVSGAEEIKTDNKKPAPVDSPNPSKPVEDDLRKYLHKTLTERGIGDADSPFGIFGGGWSPEAEERPSKSDGLGLPDKESLDSGLTGFRDIVPVVPDLSKTADLLKIVKNSLKFNESDLLYGSTIQQEILPVTESIWIDEENSTKYYQKYAPECLQKHETGVCRAFIPRWYFNASDEICYEFTYGGCQGNENNFHKEHKCYATCTGEIPCSKDPSKVCKVSDSPCKNATCPAHPDAECTVLPCTCEAVFEDSIGGVVNCNMNPTSVLETANVSVHEGRSARPEQKTGSNTDLDVDYPSTITYEETTYPTVGVFPEKEENQQDADISDVHINFMEDEKEIAEENVSSDGTEYPIVTTTPSGQNVTTLPPSAEYRPIIIGITSTVAVLLFLALSIIAFVKRRGVVEFHRRTRGFLTEDRQCFTGTNDSYGTGV